MTNGGLRQRWQRTEARYGARRVRSVALILLVGVASVAVRLLGEYEFQSSAILYIGIPYLISIALVLLRPVSIDGPWWHQYRDHVFTALAVFLASSIVLFEGFICVVFFIPIYFLIVSIAFGFHWLAERRASRGGTSRMAILPLLLLASSLEGTTEGLSFPRGTHVMASRITELAPEAILTNLATPFDLRTDRHWLLSIFPMPYAIEAGSLEVGDVHVVRTRYHRWFISNTHEGEMHLEIVEVSPHRVRTRFVHDTSFFATYLAPQTTEITFEATRSGETRVTLRIDYTRKLDPAWYFHPLQQYGVAKMAEFLIDEIMIRAD